MNRFQIEFGIKTDDGPTFIVMNMRTVKIDEGVNDRSMFVRMQSSCCAG